MALFPAVIAFAAISGGQLSDVITARNSPAAFAQKAEALTVGAVPFGRELSQMGRDIRMFGGMREIDGIFASKNGLMKNIKLTDEALTEQNISGIEAYAEWARAFHKQVYIMLIPTSAAIMRQNLPRFSEEVVFNQREFIEDVYNKMSNNTSYIDAYSALNNQREQYIYYRTEDNLTSLGGFYVYSAMLARLGIGKASLQEFDIEYAGDYFYGNLYALSKYEGTEPDKLSIYKYSESNRLRHEYTVLHKGESEKIYHTLFPRHAPVLKDQLSIFLGGLSPVTDIWCSAQSSSSILLFGDKTAISYLPYLANNLKRVTFVDLSRSSEEIGEINLDEYNQVVFAYSVETFMHTDIPSRSADYAED